jgi:hypothetical protein
MKKQLLTLSLMIMGLGMFGQSVIWQPYNMNVDTTWGVRYLDAVDTNVVWAIPYDGTYTARTSKRFTRTVDGKNFTAGTFMADTNKFSPSNISAVSDSIAFIAAYSKTGTKSGRVFKTVNGGTTWTVCTDTTTMFVGSANFPDVVHFWNKNVGWVLGDPNGGGTPAEFEIWRTRNGGTNWARVAGANIPNPLSGEYGFTNVGTTFGDHHAWYGTNMGRVYYSIDTGATWNVTAVTGMDGGVQGIAFRDSIHGLCWGQTTGATYILMSTADGGATWNAVPANATDIGEFWITAIPGSQSFMSVGINDGTTAYVTSITSDDGNTWTVLETGTTNDQRMLIVEALDSLHAWAGSFSDNILPKGNKGMNKFTMCAMTITSSADPLCVGQTATLVVGGAAGMTYTWMPSSTSGATINDNPTTNTVYTVNGTGTGCSSMVTYTLHVNPTPTVTAVAATPTICALNTTQITASGATSYQWSPGTHLNSTTSATVTGTFNTAGTYTYNVTGTANSCSSVASVTITVLPCTGIAEISNGVAALYPNPSKGNFTVAFANLSSSNKVTITDMIGNQVHQQSVTAGTEKANIDMSNMPKGMYLVTVSNNSGSVIQKMIIE